ncbi:MAG: DUF3857 domain-containing protein [Calditrichia bacterium]
MRPVIYCLAILLISLVSIQAQSDRKPLKFPKFGKIDKSILKMETYDPAPDAEAIVLFDKLEMRITDDYVLESKRHFRIKILTEEGKEYADQRIPYYYKGQKVRDLKAHTILPNGNKVKLNKKNVFDEESGKLKFKVFAIPAVDVGSVIEVKYEIESEYVLDLDPWYFQDVIYTEASQLSVIIPPGFNFRVFFYNLSDIDPIIEEQVVPGAKLKKYIWEAQNLPAIKTEPFMRTLEDYWGQMRFQLINFKNAYQYIEFIKSWDGMAKVIRERYSEFLKNNDGLKKLAMQKTAEHTSLDDKVKALYDFVTQEIVTDKRGGIYIDQDARPSKIVAEKKGQGILKNLILVNMLRAAGFEANPVLIATRNRRRASANVPDLDQFNYAIVSVKIGTKSVYMDTRDRLCPYKMLPVNSLVGEGFLVDDGPGQFVKIPAPRNLNMQRCDTSGELDEFGDLTARSIIRFEHYTALSTRRKIEKNDQETFVRKMLEDSFGNVTIDSMKVEGMDTYDVPLTISVDYSVEGFAQVAGEQLYISAPAIDAYKENPLKSETRYFPVEFTYNNASNEVMKIKLPEGFQLNEIPKMAKVGQKKLRYVNMWRLEESMLTIERQFMRRSVVFPASQYKNLRGFYDYAVKFDQQQVVLSGPGK